jgi:hypothetical protein
MRRAASVVLIHRTSTSGLAREARLRSRLDLVASERVTLLVATILHEYVLLLVASRYSTRLLEDLSPKKQP